MKYTREQRVAHKTTREIYRRSLGTRAKHPLNGLTVREFVAEAREGWPKVPVPKDPYAAAQRVRNAWSPANGKGWGLLSVEYDQAALDWEA